MEINTESQKHVLWGGEERCDFLRVDRIVGRLLVEIKEEGIKWERKNFDGLYVDVHPTIFAQSDRESDRFGIIRPKSDCFLMVSTSPSDR